MDIIDLHCDTMAMGVYARKKALYENDLHIDVKKLKEGGCLLQCFAVYVDSDGEYSPGGLSPYEYFYKVYDCYQHELAINSEHLKSVLSYGDIRTNELGGFISSLLTVEDAMLIDGKHERIDELYEKGVRIMSLTWNYENCMGYPNEPPFGEVAKPLKDFGVEAVEHMNDIGMVVDVSHLSDGGFYSVYEQSKKPFVASHSNARSVCNVSRNLTDDMLKKLAERGGVCGLNYCADFLRWGSGVAKTADIIRHAKHIVNKAGIESLALGSDFDGIDNELEFKDYRGMNELRYALSREFGQANTDKITHKNALRVFKDCFV